MNLSVMPKVRALERVGQDVVEKAGDLGYDLTRNYNHVRKVVIKGARRAIRKHPWAVLGAAGAAFFGAGLLIGLQTGRHKK